jgi:septal ring factor EnvC (AmiA/AmiB activator)
MLITSAGIFGYLSNAFQQQNIELMKIEREIAVYQTKITTNESEINRFTTQITNLQQIRNSQEANISKIVERNGSTSRLSQMVRNADKEIAQISAKINSLTEENNKNYEKINEIKNANIDIEKEVGGFRFVAEAFGVELAQVVKFFIFLIVLVFDPLAIALIIAFNGLISVKNRKEEENATKSVKEDGEIRKNSELMEKIYQIYGDNEKKANFRGKNLINSKK